MLGKVLIPSGKQEMITTVINEIFRGIASRGEFYRVGVLVSIEANYGTKAPDIMASMMRLNDEMGYRLPLTFVWENDGGKSVGFCKTERNTEEMTDIFRTVVEAYLMRFSHDLVHITGGGPANPAEIKKELLTEMAHWRHDEKKGRKIHGKSYKNGDDMTVALLQAYYIGTNLRRIIVEMPGKDKGSRRYMSYLYFYNALTERENANIDARMKASGISR